MRGFGGENGGVRLIPDASKRCVCLRYLIREGIDTARVWRWVLSAQLFQREVRSIGSPFRPPRTAPAEQTEGEEAGQSGEEIGVSGSSSQDAEESPENEGDEEVDSRCHHFMIPEILVSRMRILAAPGAV